MRKKTYADFFAANWNNLLGAGKRREVVFFPDEARARQVALFGAIGSGKSKLFEAQTSYDAIRRLEGIHPRGFALLDNQEDLFNNVFDRLALLALHYDQLYDLVYVVDPTNPHWSVKYNPLELMPWESPMAKAEQLATIFTYLYGDDSTENVRQYRVSTLSFLALILSGETLLKLPKFLTDRTFRKELVNEYKYAYPVLDDYWLKQFPRSDTEAMKWIESTMSRVERFIYMNDGIRFMLDGPSTLNFRQIMDQGAIVLVNAPIRVLKDTPSSLFLGFIMAALQDAAMSRTDIPRPQRTPFTAYCDEFQEYTTVTVQQTIRLARKVNFELFLASQDVKGLPKHQELREIIRKLVGNILVMRLSRDDAEIMADYMFTPDLVQSKAYAGGRPVFYSLAEVREMEVRRITGCPDRMVYWKRMNHPPSYFETPTVVDIEKTSAYARLPEARQALEQAAFELAGRRKIKRLPEPRENGFTGDTADSQIWG